MDAASNITYAYAITALLIAVLVMNTWIKAARTRRMLAQHERERRGS